MAQRPPLSQEHVLQLGASLAAGLMPDATLQLRAGVLHCRRPGRPPQARSVRVHIQPDAWSRAVGGWQLTCGQLMPLGITVSAAAPAILAAAAVALAAALGTRSHALTDIWIMPDALWSMAETPPLRQAAGSTPWRLRGFRRCVDGWVSLALTDSEQWDRANRAIMVQAGRDLDCPGALPLAREPMARTLQDWGLACLPVARDPEPVSAPSQGGSPDQGIARPLRSPILARNPAPRSANRLLDLSPVLAGQRVITLGHLIAGPFAGVLLAEAGAEVTHLFHPARPPLAFEDSKVTSVACDLSVASERDFLVDRLLHTTDVMLNNFRPRVLTNLGLTDRLRDSTSTLISMPAFASACSRAGWKAIGYQLEALTRSAVLPGVKQETDWIDAPPTPIVADYIMALLGAAGAAASAAAGELEFAQAPILARAAAHFRHMSGMVASRPVGRNDARNAQPIR